jgi:tripartite ATP-independent transporter DctP family solute receptor
VVIRLGHGHPQSSEFHAGALKVAELAAAKSDNVLKIDVYHSSQLGNEPELSEGIRMGTVDMALIGPSSVAKFEPRFDVFSMPYIIRSSEHADHIAESEVGSFFKAELEKRNQILLDYWESGFRHFLNNKRAVKTPEDMKGLKIRTPPSPVLVATVGALGANPIPLAFSELYMACQQGVVDGQEGPVFAIKSAKFYEVQKYMVLDGHTYTLMVVGMNPQRYRALSPELRKALSEAVVEAGRYERKLLRDQEGSELRFLETTGKMVIEKSPNKEAWRKATASVYDKMGPKFGTDLIQKILAVR